MINVKIVDKHPTFRETLAQFLDRHGTADIFSIEIEVERLENFGMIYHDEFDRIDEGSLRYFGVEFVSVQPTRLEVLKTDVTELLDKLKFNECFFSHRSSIHVHANVIHRTFADLKDIIRFYYLFEPLFFKFLGRRRNKNNFCVPLRQSHVSLTRSFPMSTILNTWGAVFPKYGALSLNRLGQGSLDIHALGTVEWRACPGTFDTKQILFPWLNMIEFIHTNSSLIHTETLENLNIKVHQILGISYSEDELQEEQITLKRMK